MYIYVNFIFSSDGIRTRMDWLYITFLVFVCLMMIIVFPKDPTQSGGWATSPGVFDQLNARGSMDRYLTVSDPREWGVPSGTIWNNYNMD